MKRQIESFKEDFYQHFIDELSLNQIQAKLAQVQADKGVEQSFIDLDFLPSDISVYNHVQAEKPLDVVIHWRRPQEFLTNDQN